MAGDRMAERSLRLRRRRSSNPDRIVDGAIDLARQVGIEQMSMAMLAEHLGVGVATIYWRFPKRDDLFAAIAQRAWQDCEFPLAGGGTADWRHTLRHHALALRDTLVDDPLLCELVLIRSDVRPSTAPGTAAGVEEALASLVAAGLPVDEACQIYNSVEVHVRGWLALRWLQMRRSMTDHGEVKSSDRWSDAGPNSARPRDPGAWVDYVVMPDDRMFNHNLECILDQAGRLIDRRCSPGDYSAVGADVP